MNDDRILLGIFEGDEIAAQAAGHRIERWRGEHRNYMWSCSCGMTGSRFTSYGRIDDIRRHCAIARIA